MTQRDHPVDRRAALAAFIDHTLLKAEATRADITRLCDEARAHRFCAVCIHPARVSLARDLLAGSGVKVCTVVGFPLGASASEVKAYEASQAIADGADEIDMVIQIGALKEGDDEMVRRDLDGVLAACRTGRALCKVILETALLGEEEKRRACRLVCRAGADFVKTSTGFGPGGATEADVALMAAEVRAAGLGVKAAGGIRSAAEAERMIAAGATRIGTSAGVKMMAEIGAA